MLRRLKEPFGKAGLIVAIVALVAATVGGAYAASDSSEGDATASAQKNKKAAKGKRGPRGPKGAKGDAGPAGPQGIPGPAGAKGDAGPTGATGPQGDDGTSVTATAVTADANCDGRDGSQFQVGDDTPVYACDGAAGEEGPEGSPWTAGGTLPSGETLMGNWGTSFYLPEGLGNGTPWTFISFNIPLATPLAGTDVKVLAVGYDGADESTPEKEACPGKAEDPKAANGKLCIYQAELAKTEGKTFLPFTASSVTGFRTGARISATIAGPSFVKVHGTWAVTAP